MSSFALPRAPAISTLDPGLIVPKFGCTTTGSAGINLTLQRYLRQVKAAIDSRQEGWDRYKKYTNPCEYVHTPVPGNKQAVCRLRPLSRSFYKLIELLHTHNLSESLPAECTSFHFAEGPGGFIEALAHYRASSTADRYYGMTLLDDGDPAIPGWKKTRSFLQRTPRVTILTGRDGTGDLFSSQNVDQLMEDHASSADLVTCDGGFDFSTDFNRQEAASMRLLLAQLVATFTVQKAGGSLVLKVFDTFGMASLDLLFLLSSLYSQVQVIKPSTSRQANSEKYVLCRGFRPLGAGPVVAKLRGAVAAMEDGRQLLRLCSAPLPYFFVSKVEELNAVLGQQQIESIAATLALMDSCRSDKLEALKKSNVQKAVGWCQRHRLPYNRSVGGANIFIGARRGVAS